MVDDKSVPRGTYQMKVVGPRKKLGLEVSAVKHREGASHSQRQEVTTILTSNATVHVNSCYNFLAQTHRCNSSN